MTNAFSLRDKNVNIIINNKSSIVNSAKITAHEIVHGVFYDKGQINPNHVYGIIGQDKDGTFILGDTNGNVTDVLVALFA